MEKTVKMASRMALTILHKKGTEFRYKKSEDKDYTYLTIAENNNAPLKEFVNQFPNIQVENKGYYFPIEEDE